MSAINESFTAYSDTQTNIHAGLVDVLANLMIVKLCARASYELNRLQQGHQHEIVAHQNAMWQLEKSRLFQSALALALVISSFALLLISWQQHRVTLGDFALLPMLIFSVLGMVWWMDAQVRLIFRALGQVRMSIHFLNQMDAESLVAQPVQVSDVIQSGSIVFDRVTFGYTSNRYQFNKLSVSIPSGQKVGLVGLSGSGKTTFAHLILGLLTPNAGRILLDGHDIQSVDSFYRNRQIAVVDQDTHLFNRSVMENIRYGNPEITDHDLQKICCIAQCDTFIRALPEGYHTRVGERGVQLSGGQKQRIAVARALVKASKILILDEALSAQDPITECKVSEALFKYISNQTILIISHRFNVLAVVDRILVFGRRAYRW